MLVPRAIRHKARPVASSVYLACSEFHAIVPNPSIVTLDPMPMRCQLVNKVGTLLVSVFSCSSVDARDMLVTAAKLR